MTKEYAVTYKFGKTTVHVVAPPPMTEEEIEEVLRDFHLAGWTAWKTLSRKEQLALNAEADDE